jgi:hypothetical protein
VPAANPDCRLEKPLSDLGMHERFQTLEASPDAAYHQGKIFEDGHAIGRSSPKAHGFVGGAPDRGDLSPRDCQIEHGGSTPLQFADPPSPRMLARICGPVHTQFGPFLAMNRERPPKKHAPQRQYRGLVKPRAPTFSDGSKGTEPTRPPARSPSRAQQSSRRSYRVCTPPLA